MAEKRKGKPAGTPTKVNMKYLLDIYILLISYSEESGVPLTTLVRRAVAEYLGKYATK